jgi:hypothetical protein
VYAGTGPEASSAACSLASRIGRAMSETDALEEAMDVPRTEGEGDLRAPAREEEVDAVGVERRTRFDD